MFEIMGGAMHAAGERLLASWLSGGPVEFAGSARGAWLGKPRRKWLYCPVLVARETYTFLSTTGRLAGTFATHPKVAGNIDQLSPTNAANSHGP